MGLLLIPACSAPVESSRPDVGPMQAVVIHNPSRADLAARLSEPWTTAVRRLGDAREQRLELSLGRWELHASLGDREWSLPLPLPSAAVRPDVVELTVVPPPEPRDGLVWIPSGPALVGDVLGVGQEDERPARVVHVPGFWMATTEVTNAQFAAFLTAVDQVRPDWLALDSRKCRIRREADGRFVTDAPELPVVTVSHAGAQAYCGWRTLATGMRHRLPTEIEWEKAARGPSSSTYSYGDVYRQDAANQESGELLPVGQFDASGFGLHDLTGNAFEWVADEYRRDAYARDAAQGRDAADASGYRVLRGGSFVLDGMFLRNSMRMKLRPGVRADDIGFRIVVEPEEMDR